MKNPLCPTCNAGVPPDSRGGLRCPECGAVLAEPFTFCPRCGRINESGASACAQCGEGLTVPCPGCRQVNWSGAERCAGCGGELDSLAHAFRSVSASFDLRRQEMVENVTAFREEEERRSQARLETLREADRRRRQRAEEMAARARLKERRITVLIGIAVVVFAAVVAIVLMLIG